MKSSHVQSGVDIGSAIKEVAIPIDPHRGEVFGNTEQRATPIFPSSRRNASTAGVKNCQDQGVLRVGIRFGGEVAIEFLQLAGFRKRSHPGKIHVENICGSPAAIMVCNFAKY